MNITNIPLDLRKYIIIDDGDNSTVGYIIHGLPAAIDKTREIIEDAMGETTEEQEKELEKAKEELSTNFYNSPMVEYGDNSYIQIQTCDKQDYEEMRKPL